MDQFTHIRGVDESTSAYAQAHALGQTSGSTIYFAVDLDPSETQVSGPVVDYFQGVAAGFAAAGKGSPAYKVGVYGSGRVCRMLVEAGLAKYTWMANATDWGESDIFKKWNINQRKHNPNLTFDNDADEAIQDYGDFALPSALSPGTAIA